LNWNKREEMPRSALFWLEFPCLEGNRFSLSCIVCQHPSCYILKLVNSFFMNFSREKTHRNGRNSPTWALVLLLWMLVTGTVVQAQPTITKQPQSRLDVNTNSNPKVTFLVEAT